MEASGASQLAVPALSRSHSHARSTSSLLEADSIRSEDREERLDGLASLTSSIVDYEYENGRRYHAYKAGHYPLPNDETELDRLDLQHHVITLLLGGELHLAPLREPKHILDIGTGTGLWAIEMADRFPKARIIGTDLSPVQPTWVPDNVSFEIDDVESEWLWPQGHFDLVHSRFMACSISDWRQMVANVYRQGLLPAATHMMADLFSRHCRPGGYIELQELDPTLLSDDGTDATSVHYKEFIKLIREASGKYGKPIPRQKELRPWVEEAGFVDVKEYAFKIPVNSWPKDKRLKEVGKYQCLNYSEGLEAIGVGLFTRVLKWQPMELSVFFARIRKELLNRDIHIYQAFTVVTGRKPFPHEIPQGLRK